MKRLVCPLFLLFSICLAALPGCQDTVVLQGEYVAQFNGEQGQRIGLELEAWGRGSWTSEEDRLELKWESHSGQIWLHTRAGSIIEGRLSPDEIEFTIPGQGPVTFKKVLIR